MLSLHPAKHQEAVICRRHADRMYPLIDVTNASSYNYVPRYHCNAPTPGHAILIPTRQDHRLQRGALTPVTGRVGNHNKLGERRFNYLRRYSLLVEVGARHVLVLNDPHHLLDIAFSV
jgi:hypothetical protein